jgi:hypothetical protein
MLRRIDALYWVATIAFIVILGGMFAVLAWIIGIL